MNTDPIADMLTRIRNAYLAKKIEVAMPYSRVKEGLAEVLEKYEFIDNFSTTGDSPTTKELVIGLAYTEEGRPRVEHIKRVSRPSLRKYVSAKEIKYIRGGFGISVVSTSQGIMAGHEAREKNLGGEVLAHVW